MHTHHSHSGQFCQHAKDSLLEVVERAERNGLRILCLTEHSPRLSNAHLYPEEIEANTTIADLRRTFDEYFREAKELQARFSRPDFKILVGFEAEGLDAPTLGYMQDLCIQYAFDMLIGSVHHVNGIPIDYDQEKWNAACDWAGSRDALFAAYFNQQHDMIKSLKPTVVGHFDLIRLFSPDHTISPDNWKLVERNIDLAIAHGCLFEINTAAIRKGWSTPYPQRDVADLIKARGGKFCLSDDSHGIAQVALNYQKIISYVKEYGPLHAADGTILEADDYEKWVNTCQW